MGYRNRNFKHDLVWEDMVSSFSSGRVPPSSAPTWTQIGATNASAYVFGVGDYIFIDPIHIRHELAENKPVYPHIHFTTDGTNTAVVRWQIDLIIAKGYERGQFDTTVTRTIDYTPSGVAYDHFISEVNDANTIAGSEFETDGLVLGRVTRVTNGGTDNTDAVYGIMMDLHHQINKVGTRNRNYPFK